MLARRFGLVVFIVAAFGMAFALLVAETAHPAGYGARTTATACLTRDGWVCMRR